MQIFLYEKAFVQKEPKVNKKHYKFVTFNI